MRSPFAYFGGKSRVGAEVWRALGDVDHYAEPFVGSGAVLLARPHKPRIETVNDLNGFICNFFRAIQHDPEGVAVWADRPVNETDLIATHLWLVNEGAARIAKLEADPFYFDSQVAGLWVWGISSWIGAAWCSGKGPWYIDNGRVLDSRKVPAPEGTPGVRRKLPNLVTTGVGINRPTQDVWDYLFSLRERLRHVRVCCGDWSRVVTTGALYRGKTVGVFLDPPYSDEGTYAGLYTHEEPDLSAKVREWALEHGEDPRIRIALCGYDGEHEMPSSWRCFSYSATRAYGQSSDEGNAKNRHKERIWFSPYCISSADGAILESDVSDLL
jgi:hypothetical protein